MEYLGDYLGYDEELYTQVTLNDYRPLDVGNPYGVALDWLAPAIQAASSITTTGIQAASAGAQSKQAVAQTGAQAELIAAQAELQAELTRQEQESTERVKAVAMYVVGGAVVLGLAYFGYQAWSNR